LLQALLELNKRSPVQSLYSAGDVGTATLGIVLDGREVTNAGL
jgi:hypothetical protein